MSMSSDQRDAAFADGTAIIVGGSGGIGAAICLAMAKAGSDVALTYRSKVQAAEDVAGQVRALGRTCEIASLRLEEPDAVKS